MTPNIEEIIIKNKLGYLKSMDLYRDVTAEILYWQFRLYFLLYEQTKNPKQ